MKFDPEEPLEVDGRVYRSIWGRGSDEEIDRLLDEDAPAKGWGLCRREPGGVLLVKPPLVDGSGHREAPAPVSTPVESDEEWVARTSCVVVPEGKVICARCAHVDRSLQMHGFVKCGTARSRNDPLTKHSWVSPVYPRECRDYAAARDASQSTDGEGGKKQ